MAGNTRCDQCSFVARSPQGLAGHKQFRHGKGRDRLPRLLERLEGKQVGSAASPNPPSPRDTGPSREELERMVEQLGKRLAQEQESARQHGGPAAETAP